MVPRRRSVTRKAMAGTRGQFTTDSHISVGDPDELCPSDAAAGGDVKNEPQEGVRTKWHVSEQS